uniref:Nucleoporin NUP42 n=1 Tax=Tetraodon nigroviridis TaxID=99883 RepID=H3DPK5_TETNG
MDEGEEEKADNSDLGPPKQLCRFFSQGRHCNFGKKCRFLHIRDDVKAQEMETEKSAKPSHTPTTTSDGDGGNVERKTNPISSSRFGPAAVGRPCRYFLSGHCAMEDRCRFWHPPQLLSVDDKARPAQRTASVPRPGVLHEVKLRELTEDVARKLRDTEIEQLKKRIPREQLIIQEQDGLAYYRATIEPTDPDWPFDLKEIDIMVSFPESYPQQVFTVDVPLDQSLPPLMARHVQQASLEWLHAKHATNELLGKVELLFRPFLRWLDRNLERLFTEGARKLKKDMDLEKAGLQFISYQEHPGNGVRQHRQEPAFLWERMWRGRQKERRKKRRWLKDRREVTKAWRRRRGRRRRRVSDPRRGTEMRMLGLRLGEDTATAVAQQITVCLQCNRCKVTADLTLTGRTPCTAQCEKCSADIEAAFRPCMLHRYSDVLGYLDLRNAAPVDLVLQECELIVGCLTCSQENPLEKLCYGQTKEFTSQSSISIPPRSNKAGPDALTVHYKVRDPAVQKGKPLPEKGACRHYKQSHRWLRFPCCGRAYPCDVCHDEDQDHPMELATRMICGYCAKEQPYANGKPCVTCGSMMTRGTRSSHWEGGLGCRNRAKMSRNDRQKYTNANKTVSKKAAGQKK